MIIIAKNVIVIISEFWRNVTLLHARNSFTYFYIDFLL